MLHWIYDISLSNTLYDRRLESIMVATQTNKMQYFIDSLHVHLIYDVSEISGGKFWANKRQEWNIFKLVVQLIKYIQM